MIRKLLLIACLALPAAVTAIAAPALAQDKNPSFTLVNKSAQPISGLFVTPAGDTNWGQNRLTSGPVAAGASFAWRTRAGGGCVNDIRVVYADGTREERREVNTCTASDLAFAGTTKAAAMSPRPATGKPADDPSFRLTNHDRQAIAELYATPAGKPRGANLLASGALPPEASIAVNPPRGQGCSFELRVVFADKSAKTRTTDLCRMTELAVP